MIHVMFIVKRIGCTFHDKLQRPRTPSDDAYHNQRGHTNEHFTPFGTRRMNGSKKTEFAKDVMATRLSDIKTYETLITPAASSIGRLQ